MTTLSDQQLQTLIAALQTNNAPQPATSPVPSPARNDAAALGPMPPCILGSNKMTRLQQFETWLEEAENRMTFLEVTQDQKKVILLRSWGGADLVKFMKTHANAQFEAIAATDTSAAVPADTYAQIVEKTKKELRTLVNRTMAMHQLMKSQQGERKWMDFVKDLEDKAHILNFDTVPYKQNDAVKDAAIFGMADLKLKEQALAEDPDLPTLIRWGQSREAGKEGAQDLQGASSTVSRIDDADGKTLEDIDAEIANLQIAKIRKQGKYSSRADRTPQRVRFQCKNCSSNHPAERKCPAKGQSCHACGGSNHFSGAQLCPKPQPPTAPPPRGARRRRPNARQEGFRHARR